MNRMDYADWLEIPGNLGVEDWAWGRCELPKRNADLVLSLGPTSVVEVGVGGGHVARRLVDAGVEYRGVDKSEACLALARRRCERFIGIQGDIRNLGSVEHAESECVACFAVTKHFTPEEWRHTFANILSLGRRFAAFDVLVSQTGRYEDTGTDWPHTWAPLTEILRVLDDDRWTLRTATTTYCGPAGFEMLCTAERIP